MKELKEEGIFEEKEAGDFFENFRIYYNRKVLFGKTIVNKNSSVYWVWEGLTLRNGLFYVNGNRLHRLNGPAYIGVNGRKIWVKGGAVWIRDRLGIEELVKFLRLFWMEFLGEQFEVCFDKGFKEKGEFWKIFNKISNDFR